MIPLVSIIIPSLEEEREIDNILSQFTPELKKAHRCEVIVSDGGSTDRTIEIARRYADRIIHAPDGAVQTIASGRNLGAREARGEILMFFNADVRIGNAPEFFEIMLRAFSKEPIVAATCNVRVHPDEERVSDTIFHVCFNSYCRFLNAIGLGMARGECHVVRKSLFDAAGGYNERIVAGEDFELFLRLRKLGRIVFLNELTVTESPRRYRAYGYFRIAFLWFLNGVSVYIFGRSVSKSWIPVR